MYRKIVFSVFKYNLIYKIDFIGSLINSIAGLAVFWFIWNAIYASSGVTILNGVTLTSMITYISISFLIRTYSHSYGEHYIHDEVKHGGIATIITKPVNYIFYNFSREIGNTLYRFVSNGVLIIIIAFLLLGIYLPQFPAEFFTSIFLGFLINFFITMLVGLWSFWAGSIWGLRFSKNVIMEITSGSVFPLFLFPDWFVKIAYFLPFQAVYNIPLSIYTGQILGSEIYVFLLMQVFWCFALGFLTLIVWKFAQRRIFIQGG